MFSKGSFFIHKTAARTFTAQTAVSPLLSLFVLIKKALQSALLGNILAHGLSEGPQGLLLLPVQGGGDLDPDGDVLVAPAPAPQLRDALPPQAEPAGRLYFTLPSMVGISSSAPITAW